MYRYKIPPVIFDVIVKLRILGHPTEHQLIKYNVARPGDSVVRWQLATVTRMFKKQQQKSPTYYTPWALDGTFKHSKAIVIFSFYRVNFHQPATPMLLTYMLPQCPIFVHLFTILATKVFSLKLCAPCLCALPKKLSLSVYDNKNHKVCVTA